MKEFKRIFNKVGGKEILIQYFRAHVLLFAIFLTAMLGFSKKSLEIVRLGVKNRILSKLRKKYKTFIDDHKTNVNNQTNRVRSNKIWICWLQGIEIAPTAVQRCYQSLKENLIDRDIILLTEANYKEYVQFPEFIQEKIENKVISKTHFSDLLRLELLISHGGTWIDSTVFCSDKNIPEYMLNSDLFVFQNLKPGLDGHSTSISSWLMTSCTNNPILLLTRALLYNYWASHTKLIDYFLVHDFFQLAIESYPDEWKSVVPFSNSTPHIILLRLFDNFDSKIFSSISAMTPFHKLSYKFTEEQLAQKGTYYDVLINKNIIETQR